MSHGAAGPIVVNFTPSPPGTAALSVSGPSNQVFGIQATTVLGPSASWIGLFNYTQPGSNFLWMDPHPKSLPSRFYRVKNGPVPVGAATWDAAEIGAVWSDDFNRANPGTNWVVLGGANVAIVGNELQFSETNKVASRQVYYNPWQICSDSWTLRWTQRFSALNSNSIGVGVGLKNFQQFGGNDRGYNLVLIGAGTNLGKVQIEYFDGSAQVLASSGAAVPLAAGDQVDCALTRSNWTMTATVSNRANAQVSSTFIPLSDTATYPTPVISRACFYPLGGTVLVDNISFTINRRKPARFLVVSDSLSEGWTASSFEKGWVNVLRSNYTDAVCNDSSSYNTTINLLDAMPEILAHQPGTAILSFGGNDLYFNVPADEWQENYSNVVAQLRAAGVHLKYCLPTPRNTEDLRPLKNWIQATYPSNSIIDLWTPFVTNSFQIKAMYDVGDHVHPNDAGHQLIAQIVAAALQ